MSVPLHWTADGLPTGVHFMAPASGDGLLFRLAVELERATVVRSYGAVYAVAAEHEGTRFFPSSFTSFRIYLGSAVLRPHGRGPQDMLGVFNNAIIPLRLIRQDEISRNVEVAYSTGALAVWLDTAGTAVGERLNSRF